MVSLEEHFGSEVSSLGRQYFVEKLHRDKKSVMSSKITTKFNSES